MLISSCSIRLPATLNFLPMTMTRKRFFWFLLRRCRSRAIYLENSVVIEISRQRPSWRVFDRHPRIFCRSSDLGSTRYCSAPVWRSS